MNVSLPSVRFLYRHFCITPDISWYTVLFFCIWLHTTYFLGFVWHGVLSRRNCVFSAHVSLSVVFYPEYQVEVSYEFIECMCFLCILYLPLYFEIGRIHQTKEDYVSKGFAVGICFSCFRCSCEDPHSRHMYPCLLLSCPCILNNFTGLYVG